MRATSHLKGNQAMTRKQEMQAPKIGRLRRTANAVKQLFTRGRRAAMKSSPVETAEPRTASSASASASETTRPGVRRETDIPMDVIDRTYTPPFTGGKAGFRSDGSDHQNDQEFAYGVSDDRWNDEDRITNKSGDPRIGTHRRTYEPAESRDESRS
jgi:hypothetical protein